MTRTSKAQVRPPSRQTPRRADRQHAAATLFGVLALVFGGAMLVATPPLQVADEGAHFCRAFQISEGTWISEKRTGPSPINQTGGDLPKSFQYLKIFHDAVTARPLQRLKRPVDMLRTFFAVKIQGDDREFVGFSNTAAYPPLAFLPQALGIAVVRLFSDSLFACFFGARVANLLAATAVTWLAIRTTPIFQWLFTFLALTPMALFQASSVSSDALTNAACFLFLAYILRCALGDDATLSPRRLCCLFVLAAAVSWVKQAYYLLVLLYLLIPVSKFGSPKSYWRTFAGLLASTSICVGLWWAVVGATYSPIRDGVDPAAQLGFIIRHPGNYAVILVDSLLAPWHLLRHLWQFVGVLGSNDTPLPEEFVSIHLVVLILVACVDRLPEPLVITRRAKAFSLALAVLLTCWIATTIYLTWMGVGAPTIQLLGRYFIPVGPLFFLVFYKGLDRFPVAARRLGNLLPSFALIYLPVSLLLALYILIDRFYVL